MSKGVEELKMKYLLFISFVLFNFNIYANELLSNLDESSKKGVSEYEQDFVDKKQDIEYFFKINELSLKSIFPEFKINKLIEKFKEAKIEFVSNEILIDEYGAIKTCLNFPAISLIKCSVSRFSQFDSTPRAIYILVLNQYLGLINVKEAPSGDDNFIDGYSISRRIFPHIVHNYGNTYLIYNSLSSKRIMSIPGYENRLHVEVWPHRRVSNNWFIENYTSLYPTERRLIKKTLKQIDEDRCNKNTEKVIYKDVKAFDVFDSRISCNNDRCPQIEAWVVVRYICNEE